MVELKFQFCFKKCIEFSLKKKQFTFHGWNFILDNKLSLANFDEKFFSLLKGVFQTFGINDANNRLCLLTSRVVFGDNNRKPFHFRTLLYVIKRYFTLFD